MYKELRFFHPACTAGTILRRLIKSVFEICYCVIEKMCKNVVKKLKCNRFLLKYGTGGLQLHLCAEIHHWEFLTLRSHRWQTEL
jgi:hypothetical protein